MRGIGPLNPAFGSSGKFDQRGITLIIQVKTCNWPDFLNLSVVAAKRFGGSELLPAIKAVLQGKRYVSRGIERDDCSGEGCSGEGWCDTEETEVLLCGRQ